MGPSVYLLLLFIKSITDWPLLFGIGINDICGHHLKTPLALSMLVQLVVECNGSARVNLVDDCTIFSMASLAIVINVSNSVSTTLSVSVSLASVHALSTCCICSPKVAVNASKSPDALGLQAISDQCGVVCFLSTVGSHFGLEPHY